MLEFMESLATAMYVLGKLVILKGIAKKNYIIFFLIIVLGLYSLKILIDQRRYFARLQEDKECWKKNALTIRSTIKTFLNIEDNFIPTEVEQAPIGNAASIPKGFSIEEKDYCSKRPFLKAISFVHSEIRRTDKRNFTRHTWAKFSDNLGVLFFVGKAKNETEQKIVDEESRLYHDMVQGHYTDEYQLLTYKGLNGLFWLSKNCKQVPWVIHADDDILLDVKQFFKFVNTRATPTEIFGFVYKRPLVQRDEKWKVGMDEYPCITYPPYCSGPAWFTSMNVVHALLAEVQHTKYLWVDDVYVTGLLAERAGIKRTDANMVNNYFRENHLGETIAWLNVLTNRTQNWQSILSYYQDKII